jgi:hypothetical protein
MRKRNQGLSPTLKHDSGLDNSVVGSRERKRPDAQRRTGDYQSLGELHSNANSQTKSKTSPLTKVQSPTLLGLARPVLLGEDPAAYDEFLGRAYAAVKPIDIIDEMLIADVVSLEWEVLRWRRLKSSLIQMLGLNALEDFLRGHLDYHQYWIFFEEDLREILEENLEDQTEDARTLAHKCAQNERGADDKVNQILAGINLDMDTVVEIARARKAKQLAQDYARRKPGAIKLVDTVLASAGVSIDAVMVRTLPDALDKIERIDRLATIAETRRNAMLREIDRRRAALGEGLRRHVQEVEGEFEVIEKTPAETQSAA